jgi:hypothetical protein
VTAIVPYETVLDEYRSALMRCERKNGRPTVWARVAPLEGAKNDECEKPKRAARNVKRTPSRPTAPEQGMLF